MELSTYFRISASGTGQFERTLIVAEEGSYVSYLEGCTAPSYDDNQLHAAVVEISAAKDAEVKYSTVQNWQPSQVREPSANVEHEASTSKIGEDQLFYFQQRGIEAADAVGAIISGFCAQVFRELPSEFGDEVNQLMSLKLEGSVG
ncbi:hypothetical protein WJX72_009261 [[Myrmecia] bisecta]|uniref:SUF system FeS cluster assembly SufBD core domain-containing protein n=1 Tax=[Myrmecia] bisecta TaxID=41462 RepID=A0AAW1Q0S9_9CHLO